ncbi:NUDIX domain-containing protein [Gordonia sp. PP30]|uniref:NUDIX hydrolase n=1 Tax=unclassified Gordonia (in: high G+C Gram-positive bacteria) TaxID=2657482 RepID=UPI001FFEB0F6|nr:MULTISPECIES: NUDIX domain-containing protein [unclassified Gordonia (in: high G+C Gram-positive bacteria)]UQE73539.1 NUDIX domain-containing protein [Gordonia sp. PP30]
MATPTPIEVLSAVFQVREPGSGRPVLCVLLHRDDTDDAPWALPGGDLGDRETLAASARRHLGAQCGLTRVAHLEQLSMLSDPDRVPGVRTIASTYLGLVPRDVPADPSGVDVNPAGPVTAGWFDVDELPSLAYDHADVVALARGRLAAKLSYTNLAFALAPERFAMSELSEIYGAALGYHVDATNLLRVLSRRGVVVATGTVGRTGRSGGRPPALYTFADDALVVTDEFATLRPPP